MIHTVHTHKRLIPLKQRRHVSADQHRSSTSATSTNRRVGHTRVDTILVHNTRVRLARHEGVDQFTLRLTKLPALRNQDKRLRQFHRLAAHRKATRRHSGLDHIVGASKTVNTVI